MAEISDKETGNGDENNIEEKMPSLLQWKTVHVRLKSMEGSTLLMHKNPLDKPEIPESKMSPEDQAERSAYRSAGSGNLYVPDRAVLQSWADGGTWVTLKARATLKRKFMGGVRYCGSTQLPLKDRSGNFIKDYVLDRQWVSNPSTGGKIIRTRACIREWYLEFDVDLDVTLATLDQYRTALEYAGYRIGILDFRPEKTGPHGRYDIVGWSPLKPKKKEGK